MPKVEYATFFIATLYSNTISYPFSDRSSKVQTVQ